jgi:DNA-binding NtrC family response regulator
LYLPTAPPVAPECEDDDATDSAQQGAGSILVVEDDEQVREVSIAMLEDLGYRALLAGNGREALEILRSAARIEVY